MSSSAVTVGEVRGCTDAACRWCAVRGWVHRVQSANSSRVLKSGKLWLARKLLLEMAPDQGF